MATLAYKLRYWLALVSSVIFWIIFGLPILFGDILKIGYYAFQPKLYSDFLIKFNVSMIVVTIALSFVLFMIFILFYLITKKDYLLESVVKIHLILQGIFLSLFTICYIIFTTVVFGLLTHILGWLSTAIPILLLVLGSVKHNVNNEFNYIKKQRARGFILNIVILIICSIALAFLIPVALSANLPSLNFAVLIIFVIIAVILNLVFNSSSPQKYLNSYKAEDFGKLDKFSEGFFEDRNLFRNIRQSIKNSLKPLLFGFGLIFTILLIALFQRDPQWVVGGMLLKIVIATIFIVMGVIAFFEITIYLPKKSKIKKAFANYKYAFPGKHTRRFFRFLIYSFFSILGIVAGLIILLGGFIGGRMTKDTMSGSLSGFWAGIFCNILFFLVLPSSGLDGQKLFIPAVALTFLVYSSCLGLLGGYSSSFKHKRTKEEKLRNVKQIN
ncbi:MAG: hypothetical protein ACTSR6_13955 [Candidatus Heimdallarchaeota archaeon]